MDALQTIYWLTQIAKVMFDVMRGRRKEMRCNALKRSPAYKPGSRCRRVTRGGRCWQHKEKR